jgi:hypothetical protein
MRGRRTRQRGQSTVEFGASAFVLVLILFGIIDLGRAFYFDVGLTGAVREGARQAAWFDPANTAHPNPFLDDTDIKSSVDAILSHSGLPASVLGNATGTTCPSTTDANTFNNPPYVDSIYPAALNQPTLYICYAGSDGVDLTAPPNDTGYEGKDVNVILVMSFGFVSGLLQGAFGSFIHLVANAHMTIGGY